MAEAMERVSHREYLVRLAWENEQWNQPDRADYYRMQIAEMVVRMNSTREGARKIRSDQFRLKFKTQQRKGRPMKLTPEQAAKLAKARWLHGLGISKIVKRVKKTDGGD